MKITLAGINSDIIREWQRAFAGTDVEVIFSDIFQLRSEAVVSPANSFGIMDGGIEGKYRDFFGMSIEDKVRERIKRDFHGELLVGQAFITDTGDERFPRLISAPTMRVPSDVSGSINAYLAFKAILFTTLENGVESMISPGLASLSGRMPYNLVARQMRAAYDFVFNGSYHYSHWRFERDFEAYLRGEFPFAPEDH